MIHQRTDAARRRNRGGKRGDARNFIAYGSSADRFLIVEGLASERRIDDEIYPPRLDQIDDVGPPFIGLVDGLRGYAGSVKPSCERSRASGKTKRLS
jgi:hypothetical protein